MSARITDADRVAAHANIAAHSEQDCEYWRGCWVGRLPKPEHQPICDRLAQAIADAREAGALHQRRIDAAHAFDRCEQYQESSGCYEAVNQVAISIARGSANEADQHGEFEPELMARVDRIAARAKR